MIVSSDNTKLKLVRKLQSRKWREREGAFVTEGEDLLEAGRVAGWEPLDVLVPADSRIEGTEVEPDLLDGVSALGSGTRVIAIWPLPKQGGRGIGTQGGNFSATSGVAVYLHGVSDPGNVGTIIRTADALDGADVLLGPGSADAYSPKAVRASMGSIFAISPSRAQLNQAPRPRLALTAHGSNPLDHAIATLGSVGTLVLGAEREGLPPEVEVACEATATIRLRQGAESLNVAAAAAIGLQRICSLGAAGSRGSESSDGGG